MSRPEFDPPERTGEKWEDLKRFISAKKQFLLYMNQRSNFDQSTTYSAHLLALIALIEDEMKSLEKIDCEQPPVGKL